MDTLQNSYRYNKPNHPKKNIRRYQKTITSYGIILVAYRPERTPVVLLYQRRDNFAYIDFLRGLWFSEDQIISLFSLMSHEERNRIRDYTFRELWDDLWVEHTFRFYRDGFSKARKKYNSTKHNIPRFLETTSTNVSNTPWGFPKGKKNNYHENPLKCAMREFEEETNISENNFHIIDKTPFTESFRGSNDKSYSTHYFLAETNHRAPIYVEKKATPQCIRKTTVTEEAAEVSWFTFEEACEKLNPRRQSILRTAFEYLEGCSNII